VVFGCGVEFYLMLAQALVPARRENGQELCSNKRRVKPDGGVPFSSEMSRIKFQINPSSSVRFTNISGRNSEASENAAKILSLASAFAGSQNSVLT
jgi:hypothetical protein